MSLRNGLASLRSSGRAPAGGLVPVVALVVAAFVTPGLHAGEKIVFNRDIRPILSEKCFACHGPDKKQRKADLRLDLVDEAIKDEVIVVGKPEESEFVARVDSEDPDEMMPPPHSNKTLTPAEKELLRRWIAEGAVSQGHWAYEMPVKPQVAADANADRRPGEEAAGHARHGAVARGRSPDARAAAVLRPARPAPEAGGGRGLRRGHVARRLREAGRQAARLPALRRADGDRLARPGPLRRHHRLSLRHPAERLALSRLRHRRVQREHAVRPVHHRAARRRPPARRDAESRRSPRASTGCC